jgi:pyruvate ferredoxin oxidoreductase beta subunit
MPYQRIKFYQTGSFAVGNRLLDEEQRSVQSGTQRSNALTCGHRACQGCGEALGARYALDAVMRATDGKMIAVNATGCLEVFSTPFPETSWQIAWLHSLFGNAPAVASGVAAALKAMGRIDIRVVGHGGDGGTVDIGMGCLSGMFERNDDVLYICYDNQAYMNTGVQRSGATPPAARTATTQAVGREPGNRFGQGKNAPLIAMAHEIPYVATATVADLHAWSTRPPGRWTSTGLATCTSWCPARSAGAPPRPTRSRSPGWPPKAACSRSSRPRPAR